MHRCAGSIALAGTFFLAPAGCFYTGSINDRPRADIEIVTAGPYYPGTTVELAAHKSGDLEDGGSVSCEWGRLVCEGEGDEEECRLESAVIPCSQSYTVLLPKKRHDPLRIQLEVTDQDGASSMDTETIPVGNRPPRVDISLPPAPSFVVTLPIDVAATVEDDDGDETIGLTWELVKPRGAGADVELVPFGLGYRFTPDTAGIWRVDVLADDGFPEGSSTAMREVAVDEDQPPCIGTTTPEAGEELRIVFRREDGPRTLEVHGVEDDLDPYPRPEYAEYLGEASFSWHLASPDTGGELVPVAGATASALAIDPSIYAPGDLLDIRVEVADRVGRTLPCDPAAPACSIGGGTCHQRKSWGVEIR